MVNGVSNSYVNPSVYATARTATQAAGRYSNDVENLVKYMNGQPLTPQDSQSVSDIVKGNIPFLAIFGAITAFGPLKSNGFNLKKVYNSVNAASAIKTRGQYLQAAKAGVADKFKDVFKKSVPVSDAGRWKIFKLFDKIPGYSKLRHTGFGQMLKKTGAGSWALFGGAIEMFTQVVPAFQQGGASAGFKQIGKSSVKVAADAAGFVAGDVIGRSAGAAIGTLICPGIGTAIGSFIGGFMGGMVGSALAGKAAKSLIGPSEVEKIQEQQTAQVAQQIEADPNAKVALAQQALQQAEAVLAQDPENADALAAKASAEQTLLQASQQAQADVTQAVPSSEQYAQYPQANGMMTMQGVPVVPGFNGMGYDMNLYRQAMQNTSSISTTTQQTNPFGKLMTNYQV